MNNARRKESSRILFVLPFWAGGGAEKQFRFIVEGLLEEGYKVEVITLSGYEGEVESGLNRFLSWDLPISNGVNNRWLRYLLRLLGYFYFTARFLCCSGGRFDTIIAHHKNLIPLIPVLKVKSRRLVFSLREADPDYTRGGYRKLLSLADIITCNSERTYEMTGDEYETVKLIKNGIRVEKDDVGPDLSPRVDRLGVVANMTPRKNIELAVKALNFLPERMKLSVAGKPKNKEYTRRMEELVAESGQRERVSFLGYVDDIEDFYRNSDLMVLPSLYEGTSNVVLESFRAGRPIICSDIEENRVLFERPFRDEVLFDPESPRQLAERVEFMDRKFRKDPDWVEDYVKSHFCRIREEYCVDRLQREYVNLLKAT